MPPACVFKFLINKAVAVDCPSMCSFCYIEHQAWGLTCGSLTGWSTVFDVCHSNSLQLIKLPPDHTLPWPLALPLILRWGFPCQFSRTIFLIFSGGGSPEEHSVHTIVVFSHPENFSHQWEFFSLHLLNNEWHLFLSISHSCLHRFPYLRKEGILFST